MKRFRKYILLAVSAAVVFCGLFVSIIAIDNRNLPQKSRTTEELSSQQKSLLFEAIHLRMSLGDAVWPGWAQADLPAIVYNEGFAFLTGYPQPPHGWQKIPSYTQHGGAWEEVPGDNFQGEIYYRQYLPDPNQNPQAFAVKVGDRWGYSTPTMEWMQVRLIDTIRNDLRPILQPVFPYRLFVGQLIGGSDHYITLLNHEAFHAYQGIAAPEKLTQAESANARLSGKYPWQDSDFQTSWEEELYLLAEMLKTSDQKVLYQQAQKFLALRSSRREKFGLSSMLIQYEQQREWVEGLARYAELEIWRLARDGVYEPDAGMQEVDDFSQYQGFARRWERELGQFASMADDEGDGRFYYSGMAQAFVLDRLLPDWKLSAMKEGVWLDDLLASAVLDQ